MTVERRTFPPRLADLGFSMEAPSAFGEPDYPLDAPDFTDPTVSAPLAVLMSPVALAIITVSARPAYEDGSVIEWLQYLCGHFGITLTALMPDTVGGSVHRHPAVLAEGHQTQEGTLLQMRMALVEDGGRLVTVHAMCPDELAPSFLPTMTRCVHSFELTAPRGPTAPLVPGVAVSNPG